MIRFCSKAICQNCRRFESVYNLTKINHVLESKNKPSCSSDVYKNSCSLRHFSIATPSPATKDGELPDTPRTVSIFEIMEGFGFEDDKLKLLFENQPDLRQTSPAKWKDCIPLFLQHSFEKHEVLIILDKYPRVLTLKKNELENNLDAWMKTNIKHDLVIQVLTTHPYLLLVNHADVLKRIKQYQSYFESKNRVGKLLLLAPNTLEESWTTIIEKLNFLDELCTDKSDVVSSGVLAHSMFHIKTRHEFLIRAGCYKMPQKNFHKRLSKNPKLEQIVNTTNEEFVRKVAGLSMFEYTTFVDLMDQDIKDNEAYDSDEEEDPKLYYIKRKFELNENKTLKF